MKDGEEKMVCFWEPFLCVQSMMDDDKFNIPINKDLCLLKYSDSDDGLNWNSLLLFYPETGAIYLIEKSDNHENQKKEFDALESMICFISYLVHHKTVPDTMEKQMQ